MSDEIKLPEPAFRLRWDGASASYRVSKPNIGDTDVYTAEQVRALLADSKAGVGPVATVYVGSCTRDGFRIVWTKDLPDGTHNLYTRPQQQAKPLTDDDLDKISNGINGIQEPMSQRDTRRLMGRKAIAEFCRINGIAKDQA